MVAGMVLVSSSATSDHTASLGELDFAALSWSVSGLSNSDSHDLACKTSCLMITSVSVFHSRCLFCTSYMRSWGANWHSFM